MDLTEPLKIREFRRFWLATTVSLTGDQLTFIAMPWLVLKLTGDPLVMGTVIAVAAVPRAVFMLIGGAVTDTYSPRVVMIVSNLVRMMLMGILTYLTFSGQIDIWVIFVIAFTFGLADAFMFPAASAFPPRLLERHRLAAGNSLIQGTAQLTLVIGPLLAGLLIAGLSGGDSAIEDSRGLSLVFGLDTLTFIVPIIALASIRDRFPPEQKPGGKMLGSLVEGLRYTWQDVPLRTFALMLAVLSLVFRGPFVVGIPAFADAYLSEGAAGFGIIMSALGVGSIIGTIVAGTTRHPAPHRLGVLLLLDFASFGLIFISMTYVHHLELIAGAVFVGGILDGYIIILLITWTQKRVPAEKLGRVMSVVMLFGQGLFPLSSAVAGAAAGWDLLMMLGVAGVIMLSTTLVGFAFPVIRRMGYPPQAVQKG